MQQAPLFARVRSFFLFIMLVLCTMLHGYSVAHIYLPAVAKMLSVLGIVSK